MLIRSQDKKALCLLSNIEIIEKYKNTKSGERETVGYAIYNLGENDIETVLADYSTEEKAIRALDMICNFADEKHYEKIVTEKCGCISGVVFDMPQDSEV